MTSKYNRSILLISVISLCLSVFSNAQTPSPDTVNLKPEINVAYGTQPAWMVTGAVSTIRGSDIQSPFTPNFPSRLFGRIPGLSVGKSSAEPGFETISLYSRGINTFGVDGTGMLVLVDGIEANYKDLVPEEVESVTLLKDASATAMYGARGANGVLLITTNRGVAGKLKVVLSTQQGWQSATSLPKFLGSYDYARLYNEAWINDGKDPANLPYKDADLASYQSGDDPYFHPDVNWYNQLLRKTAPISNYNLNFSGGNSSVRYFVLLNQQTNNSLFMKSGDQSNLSINSSYKRINFRSNIDIDITKSFSAQVTLGGTVVDKANPMAISAATIFTKMSQLPPNLFPVYNPDGTWSRSSLITNPVGDMLNTGFYTSNGRTLLATVGLKEKLDMLIKGLSISARVSSTSWFLSQSSKSSTYRSFALSKSVTGDAVLTPYSQNSSLTGSEGESDQYRTFAFQSFLNYDRVFGVNTVNSEVMYNADDFTVSGNSFPAKHLNISGRATFTNNQKYIGEFSFSWMGSALFPKNGRFGFFPAASLGWIVSNEEFLKNNNAINFLKIRASYGKVGNDLIGGTAYMFQQYYTGSGSYYLGTSNSSFGTLVQGSLANPGVTWEKEKSLNIGLEATMMKHVDLKVDVFNRDRYGILVQPLLTNPDFMGYRKPYLNQGKANNKGFEGTLRIYNDESKDLKFFVEASVWYYKNKMVFSSEALQKDTYLYRTGQAIGQPFGLVAIGFFQDQADIDASPKQIWTNVKPGDVKYQDQNGDNVINTNDSYPIGNSGNPNLTAGLHAGVQYKGFDFDFFFQGVTGRTVTFDGYYFQAFQNNGQIAPIALGRWTPATASSATYPRLSTLNDDNNFRYSTLWQHDGSFIKLRSIELGYNIPQKITQKVLIDNARVFINGTDLFSFDHMLGYGDPEIATGYPAVKSYSIGVRVQFK